jgi:hypothetical protein
MIPTTTPAPVDSLQAAGMSSICNAGGNSAKLLPGSTAVCTQPATCFIG